MGLALTFALAGAVAVLAMAWTVLAALSADGARGRGLALGLVLAVLATAPLAARGLAARGIGLPAWSGAVGATLILAAAALCLWRLRALPGARGAAWTGIAACAVLWAILVPMRGAAL
jgi:hypothetical protein